MVGETVNIASRIQNLNKEYETDILISDEVLKGVDQKKGMRSLSPVKAKGIREPLYLYSLDKEQPVNQ